MHCHILPGVDDGSKDPETTKKMLEMAAGEGIEAIVATPHFEAGMKPDFLARRREALKLTRSLAAQLDKPIKIYYGNELFYGDSTVSALESGKAATINGTEYVLVEFPVYSDFTYIEKAARNIQYAGFKPVIAHIERYEGLKKSYQVEELVAQGMLMQVNTSTLTGDMGWGIKHYVLKLMKAGLVHLLGTDAHSVSRRRPEMREALRIVDKKIGKEYRELITEIYPRRVLKGEKISGKA